jgi:hypothetical protein
MDRYFDAGYDPRLDVAALGVPVVPATGLLDDADFAGWEAMLELVKIRRQDRAERRWAEKHGGAEKAPVLASASSALAQDELGVMDIQYKKRGSVREWDMGKDGVD